jgi:hypothetical protein
MRNTSTLNLVEERKKYLSKKLNDKTNTTLQHTFFIGFKEYNNLTFSHLLFSLLKSGDL